MTFSRVNFIFVVVFSVFVIDAIINNITAVPLFVTFLPFIVFYIMSISSKISNYILSLSLLFIVVLGSRYTININDIGYFIYMLFFLISFFYLNEMCSLGKTEFSLKIFRFIFVLTTLLFWVYLFGIDNQIHSSDMTAEGANVEYYREYHSGFFRAPHFPSYIYYFLFLCVMYFKSRFSKLEFAIIVCISILGILLSGSRTPIYSFLAGSIIYFAIKNIKYFFISLIFLFSTLLVYIYIESILEFTKGSILYQYFSFIFTLKNDPERLSRVQLFFSFYDAMRESSLIDIFIGHSFSSQFNVVFKALGQTLWFHNDMLSIIYSYGVVFFSYIFFLIVFFYIKVVKSLRNNVISIYFISIIIFSFVNGIIYHPSYLFILMLFWMISNERKSKGFNTIS